MCHPPVTLILMKWGGKLAVHSVTRTQRTGRMSELKGSTTRVKRAKLD